MTEKKPTLFAKGALTLPVIAQSDELHLSLSGDSVNITSHTKELTPNKRISDWLARSVIGKLILQSAEQDLSLGKTDLIQQSKVHTLAVSYFCTWSNNIFAFQVCKWIDEWRAYTKENASKYLRAVLECLSIRPVKRVQREKTITEQVAKMIGGTIGVVCDCGIVDLMTDDKIIEIKTYKNWKHAFGQVLAYGYYFPEKNKYVYLFDVPEGVDLITINKITIPHGVKVKEIKSVHADDDNSEDDED